MRAHALRLYLNDAAFLVETDSLVDPQLIDNVGQSVLHPLYSLNNHTAILKVKDDVGGDALELAVLARDAHDGHFGRHFLVLLYLELLGSSEILDLHVQSMQSLVELTEVVVLWLSDYFGFLPLTGAILRVSAAWPGQLMEHALVVDHVALCNYLLVFELLVEIVELDFFVDIGLAFAVVFFFGEGETSLVLIDGLQQVVLEVGLTVASTASPVDRPAHDEIVHALANLSWVLLLGLQTHVLCLHLSPTRVCGSLNKHRIPVSLAPLLPLPFHNCLKTQVERWSLLEGSHLLVEFTKVHKLLETVHFWLGNDHTTAVPQLLLNRGRLDRLY